MKLKRYLPIGIFSIKYAYGWWWGSYFFFFGKHSTAFAILPMSDHFHLCEYMNGNVIKNGTIYSWSVSHQSEKMRKTIETIKANGGIKL